MIVHFIGGPVHGRSEAIQNPHPIWKMVTSNPRECFVACGDFPSLDDLPFTEHEYKITRRTPRYAIAEWSPPPVDVRFEVRLELDPFDRVASEELRRLFYERRTEPKFGVRCIGAAVAHAAEATFDLVVRVDGPEDVTAVQLASEKVQHYIDSELPHCKKYVRSTAAAVN